MSLTLAAQSVDTPKASTNPPFAQLLKPGSAAESRYGFLQQQIYRGEAASARNEIETIISQIEAARHRYHEDLVIPVTLLGDILMVNNEIDKALDQYDRARHIARVSHGLFDIRQLPVVYREADAFRKLGDLQNASQREEYAYEVMLKSYDPYDPAMIPGIMRLGNFYLHTYNYLAARSMYSRALNVHAKNGTDFTVQAIEPLRGIAKSHRLERFPPFYVASTEENRFEGPTPGLTTSDLDRQYAAFNNFPAGEKALQQVVEIRRQQDPEDVRASADAITELADWHLMFGRGSTANTLYSYVYEQLEENELDAAGYFAQPELIYLPLPSNPRRPRGSRATQSEAGFVTLEFNVTPNGRIRELKTAESQPPKLMDFRVRRSMRLAIYRPQLIEGVAVMSIGQTYRHEFDYYPSGGPVVPGETETATGATPETLEGAVESEAEQPQPANQGAALG